MKSSINTKFNAILALIALLAAFLIIQGVTQVKLSNEVRQSSEQVLSRSLPANDLFLHIQDSTLRMKLASMGVVFGMDPESINAKDQKRIQLSQSIIEQLDQLKQMDLKSDQIGAAIREMNGLVLSHRELMDKVKKYMDDDEIFAASEVYDAELPSISKSISELLSQLQSELLSLTEALSEANLAASTKGNTYTKTFSGISISLALILGFACLFLSANIRNSLHQVITTLDQNSGKFLSSSESMTVSSQQLAEGASEQAALLEETSSSINELSSMVGENSEVTETTNRESKQTSSAASAGVALMEELREGVNLVNQSADDMRVAIEEIKDSSDSISKIIKTIDEIAFQTNILALNAAVEAARAGEAGAGFAVVADEVRSLAGRAADAARETSAMIEKSVERSTRGVEVNELVNQRIHEVLDRADKVGGSLSEIVQMANNTSQLMDGLSASYREQAEGITQINDAVAQVSQVTQRNAEDANESANISVEISEQANSITQTVDYLSQLINKKSAANSNRSTETKDNSTDLDSDMWDQQTKLPG